MVALWANGLRPAKSKPGHHQAMIQSLVHTVELGRDQILLLETFRIKRNAIDYTGDDIDEASVDECIEAVQHLLQWVTGWLLDNKPDMAE